MHGFITLSSLFVASTVLVIIHVLNGQANLAILPGVAAFVTGCAIVRMMKMPYRRQNSFDD